MSQAPDLGVRGKVAVALSLTSVGGFVDAVGYIALFEVFTANMSGNSVHVGMYLGQRNWMELLRPFCAIVSYVVGMALTRIAVGIAGRTGIRRIASFTLATEALLLAIFAHARPAMHLGQIVDQRSAAYFSLVALLAFAMGSTDGNADACRSSYHLHHVCYRHAYQTHGILHASCFSGDTTISARVAHLTL